ncbi:unnamed protein product [Moneuplotes crassus]|uniref:Uncharacterized protein n=1 Tax=Euplotes crassus TaxID=5936 RepID=A0AAD1UHY9_EUPCR|nr:unnamed protein product [Moneuplotes crassus]
MGNTCCIQPHQYDENKTTWITYESLAQDFEDHEDPGFLLTQESKAKTCSFKIKISKFRGKKFCCNKCYIDIKFDNDNQKLAISSDSSSGRENLKWSLDQTLFLREKYGNLKRKYFNLSLKRRKDDTDPFAKLKIDLLTLANGPICYTVRMKHMHRPDEIAGILSFKVEVEQLQNFSLTLNSINCKFLSNMHKGMYITFRIITCGDSLDSDKSKSVIGEFAPDETYQTKYKWDTMSDEGKDIQIQLTTTIESLKSSSVQVCVWNDKSMRKYDDMAEIRYKRFLNSDYEDHCSSPRVCKAKKVRSRARLNSTKEIPELKYESANPADLSKNSIDLLKMDSGIKTANKLLNESMVENVIQKALIKKIKKRRADMANLEGECYFSFQKLLSKEFRNMDRKDYDKFEEAMRKPESCAKLKAGKSVQQLQTRKSFSKNQVNDKFFKETIWLFGKKVGQTKGIFKVKLGNAMHQMGVGVMTENGISFSTSLVLGIPKPLKNIDLKRFFKKGEEHGKLPEKFIQLNKLVKELYELEKTCSKRSMKLIQKRENLLKEIIGELSKTIGSRKNTIYNDLLCLIRTQDLLIVFYLHCITVCDRVSQLEVRQYYYKIMLQLLKSQELELAQIGFRGDSMLNKSVFGVTGTPRQKFMKPSSKLNKIGIKNSSKIKGFMANHENVNQNFENSKANLEDVIKSNKVLIGLNYQYVLCKTLKYALNKLGRRGGISDDHLRDFIEKFIPIAYFRIPTFREKFLTIISQSIIEEDQKDAQKTSSSENDESLKETTPEDSFKLKEAPEAPPLRSSRSSIKRLKILKSDEISEWFRIEFPKRDDYEQKHVPKSMVALDESEATSSDSDEQYLPQETKPATPKLPSKKYGGAIGHIFDWDRHFYDHLPDGNEQKKESDKLLQKCVDDSDWHDRIKKRGIGFLLIVAEWSKFVKGSIVPKNIFWQDVPGYKLIVKAILREMKNKSLLLYPEALIDCTMSLLSNEKVLSVLVKIVFKKTNIYDKIQVIYSIDLVIKWLNKLQNNYQYIPASFDFSFFNQCVKTLLDQDHLILRTKCLWMIYKSLHLFPAEAKEELINMIVTKYFNKLFFNWSFNVRSLVTHVLLYQLHFIHFEMVKIMNEKPKHRKKKEKTPKRDKFESTIMRNLQKPKKAAPEVDDEEAHYEHKISEEYEKIAILKNTDVIKKVKERMDDIKFLVSYYTGKDSRIHKSKPKKVYSGEKDDDQMESNTRYQKIIKKIPKNLHVYVEPAITQFVKEREAYELWADKSRPVIRDKQLFMVFDHLPEIKLNVPVDEPHIVSDEW